MQCLWLMSWSTSVDVYSHSATAEQSLACRTLGCSSCWLTGFCLSEMHLSFLIPFLMNCLKQCSHCTWLPGWFSLCCCEHSSVTALLYIAFNPGLDVPALYYLSSRMSSLVKSLCMVSLHLLLGPPCGHG